MPILVRLNVTLKVGRQIWSKGSIVNAPIPNELLTEVTRGTGTVTVLKTAPKKVVSPPPLIKKKHKPTETAVTTKTTTVLSENKKEEEKPKKRVQIKKRKSKRTTLSKKGK